VPQVARAVGGLMESNPPTEAWIVELGVAQGSTPFDGPETTTTDGLIELPPV